MLCVWHATSAVSSHLIYVFVRYFYIAPCICQKYHCKAVYRCAARGSLAAGAAAGPHSTARAHLPQVLLVRAALLLVLSACLGSYCLVSVSVMHRFLLGYSWSIIGTMLHRRSTVHRLYSGVKLSRLSYIPQACHSPCLQAATTCAAA